MQEILRWQSESSNGKLAGTFDPSLKIEGESAAFFGFWESPEDLELDQERFSALEDWARQQGARRLYGPIDSSTLGRYRLQVSAFDDPATFPGEPRNSIHYVKRIEELGYRVAQSYVTYWSSRIDEIRGWADQLSKSSWGILGQEFGVRPLGKEYWAKRKEALRAAVNDIFAENFAFKRVDAVTFSAAFGGSFLGALCPATSFAIEHVSGDIAALCVCFPGEDASKRTLYVKTLGIVSKYRGHGVSLVSMILEILARAQAAPKPYDQVALCLMREGNFPSLLLRPLIENERRYALYYKTL